MCVTFSEARLSGTIIYIGKVFCLQRKKWLHVLGYQTNAVTGGPNAMILHIPGKVADLINTSNFATIFTDMRAAVDNIEKTPLNRSTLEIVPKNKVQHYQIGDYHVLKTDSIWAIPEELKKVEERKRPTISSELVEFYGTCFPNREFIIWCFDNTVATGVTQPILFTYEPDDPDTFELPGVDSHDGKAPKKEQVARDHWLIYGAPELDASNYGRPVYYTSRDIPPNVMAILPRNVVGISVQNDTTFNGDFVLPVSDILNHYPEPTIKPW